MFLNELFFEISWVLMFFYEKACLLFRLLIYFIMSQKSDVRLNWQKKKHASSPIGRRGVYNTMDDHRSLSKDSHNFARRYTSEAVARGGRKWNCNDSRNRNNNHNKNKNNAREHVMQTTDGGHETCDGYVGDISLPQSQPLLRIQTFTRIPFTVMVIPSLQRSRPRKP